MTLIFGYIVKLVHWYTEKLPTGIIPHPVIPNPDFFVNQRRIPYIWFIKSFSFMNQLSELQQNLFKEIKDRLPQHVSFVHEISELLGVSYDSAYRRIRGEKIISIEELFTLCTTYHVSVDSVFQIQSQKIAFDTLLVEPDKISIRQWLEKISRDIENIISEKGRNIIYSAKDIPFYHYFHIPEIAAFKIFFWQKTLFQFPEFRDQKFNIQSWEGDFQRIGNQILKTSYAVQTTEIWNEDTFTIFLRQIEYYWVSGFFHSKDDLVFLLNKLEIWIRHLRLQAEYGAKFPLGETPSGPEDNFRLYENDVVLNDNTILVELPGRKVVYLTYNVVSFLMTSDAEFTGRISEYLKGLISKSTLISASADKERNRFFNKLLEEVERFRQRLEKQDF